MTIDFDAGKYSMVGTAPRSRATFDPAGDGAGGYTVAGDQRFRTT